MSNYLVTRELENRLEQIRDRDLVILGQKARVEELEIEAKTLGEIRQILEEIPGKLSPAELIEEIAYLKRQNEHENR